MPTVLATQPALADSTKATARVDALADSHAPERPRHPLSVYVRDAAQPNQPLRSPQAPSRPASNLPQRCLHLRDPLSSASGPASDPRCGQAMHSSTTGSSPRRRVERHDGGPLCAADAGGDWVHPQ